MLNKLFPLVVYHQSDENPNVRYALVKTLNVMMTSISEYGYIYNYSNIYEKPFYIVYYSTVRMIY